MRNGRNFETHQVWRKFAPFEVFGDHSPMQGFRLVIKVATPLGELHELIEARAQQSALLDPDLARSAVRAGLGLVRSGVVSFAYATAEETVLLVRGDVSAAEGASIEVQNQLLSMFSARLSLLVGRELLAESVIYEFPDMEVVRRAFCALAEGIEESTPLRSSIWLGHQLRGRGQPFHPSMVETLEEQSSLLQQNGIDMDALPSWWWRGVAVQARPDGAVEIYDELPGGEEFGTLLEGA